MINSKKKVHESTSESIGSTHERRRLYRIVDQESTSTGGKRRHQKFIRKSKERRWTRDPRNEKYDNYRFQEYPDSRRYRI